VCYGFAEQLRARNDIASKKLYPCYFEAGEVD